MMLADVSVSANLNKMLMNGANSDASRLADIFYAQRTSGSPHQYEYRERKRLFIFRLMKMMMWCG